MHDIQSPWAACVGHDGLSFIGSELTPSTDISEVERSSVASVAALTSRLLHYSDNSPLVHHSDSTPLRTAPP